MKIYVNAPNENWILDRYKKEWSEHNLDYMVSDPKFADILWMLDTYTWANWDPIFLKNTKLVSTITHIAPEKFDYDAFRHRDQFVDHYHAMCSRSAEDLRQLTDKPIASIQFWVNADIWKELSDFDNLREKYNLPNDKILIGSFQRDTEGHDLKTPKLVKGPDLFCDHVEHMKTIGMNVEVVLSGWRRQYVMNRLDVAGIKYHYFEMCDFKTLNELYNCLDLYIVSSRKEGGPQAIPECAITRTPIISRDVGLASELLAPEAVNDELRLAKPNVEYAYDKIWQYTIQNHMHKFNEFFKLIAT